MPSEETYFKPGNKAGKGRPKGAVGGRQACLNVLDKMLSDAGNKELLREKLQERFNENPPDFMLKFVYPVLPKEADVKEGSIINIVIEKDE